MITTRYVCEIIVKDPDKGDEVALEVHKHPNGVLFAIDASYLDQVSNYIHDPFVHNLPPLDVIDEHCLELPEPN